MPSELLLFTCPQWPQTKAHSIVELCFSMTVENDRKRVGERVGWYPERTTGREMNLGRRRTAEVLQLVASRLGQVARMSYSRWLNQIITKDLSPSRERSKNLCKDSRLLALSLLTWDSAMSARS
ncbi:hypothetical protein AALO_G00142350 [Alosa alosa]|uniref:Uncharacterized protein n=1 Tax=Alosa alosa TaxID=278164 RepID=A0AAV6GIC7_9TELE|nr:hypothetical protein AALO_G00142350 [Alosa alosa]